MKWDDLQYFLAVARTGQLARAANALGVDATTVGRRVKRLEGALETTLFERNREGQILTEAGLRLLHQAEAIEKVATGIDSTHDDQQGVSGRIRVSVSEGFGTWFISRHLGGFADAHPRISIDLAANSGFLDPSRREADVAILLARPRRGPLITRKLTDYNLCLYGAADYLDRCPPIQSAADLRHHRLIGYIPDLLYAPELRYLDEITQGLEPRLRSSSINAQTQLAVSGAGIAVLPRFIGDCEPALRPLLPEITIQRSFWIVTHQDTRHLPRIRRFVEWVSVLAQAERGRLMRHDRDR